jgi:cystathionine gamma-synthase
MREPSKKKSPPVSDPPETREDRRFAHNSLVPPIFQSATFPFERAADLAAFHAGELDAFFYSRYGNPTQTAAEARLARLEGAECSLLFASGMAAVSSVLLPLLAPGARLVIPAECYRHSRDFAEGILARYGVLVERLSENTLEALSDKAEGSVRVLFVEIPSNPTMRIPDLARLAEWARSRGAKLVVDATIASPALLRPLDHGADLVLHSATKYLSGHNDLMAGAVSGEQVLIDPLKEAQALLGSIISPHTAFLLDRGMKTLALRLERQSETALRLAEYLSGVKKVERVHYPGLPSHPDHETARRYLKAFGALVSFEMRGGPDAADRLVDELRVPVLAAGFGGTESQAEHHAKMAFADLGLEGAKARGVTPGLIRFAVGIEDYEVLREDLKRAFRNI